MKRVLLAGATLLTLSFVAAPAIAETSVCDQALRVSSTDLGYSGGLEPRLERIYRSDSPHPGLFGRGWGSPYETRVTMEADGSLLVHENGCGPTLAFHPVQDHPGLWEAKGCGDQQIQRSPAGFERELAGGGREIFSTDGRLLRATDSNGNWVAIRYDGNHIATVEDNFGRTIAFVYGPDGHLDRVRGEDGREASYRFDLDGRIIGATDSDGTEHRYGYAEDGRLTSEEIPGHAMMTATYESGRLLTLTENGAIRRFTGDDGEGWREFREEAHDAAGNLLSKTRRIVLYQRDEQGHNRRWRELSERNGSRIDTEYNDRGQPAIKHDGTGRSAGFRYDASGRLTHKETPEETVDIAYDPSLGKISRVERRSPGGQSWFRYGYDNRGNLIVASNSKGRKAELRYDEHGRITEITEHKRHLTFTYNRDSRPASIALAGGGTIRVDYDGKGEISHVESDSDPAMALKVTSVFQSLLALVQPAKVQTDL